MLSPLALRPWRSKRDRAAVLKEVYCLAGQVEGGACCKPVAMGTATKLSVDDSLFMSRLWSGWQYYRLKQHTQTAYGAYLPTWRGQQHVTVPTRMELNADGTFIP